MTHKLRSFLKAKSGVSRKQGVSRTNTKYSNSNFELNRHMGFRYLLRSSFEVDYLSNTLFVAHI